MVPEPKDYRSWSNQMNSLEAAAASGHHVGIWSLPGGQTYRVTGRPHPDGAVAFLFEDITSEISLTRQFRADLSLGAEVLEESVFEPFFTELEPLLSGKKIALFGSYGWGDGGWMREWVERMNGYGAQVLEEGLIVQGSPDGGEADRCKEYGTKVANF